MGAVEAIEAKRLVISPKNIVGMVKKEDQDEINLAYKGDIIFDGSAFF